jgi:hypothetical protein
MKKTDRKSARLAAITAAAHHANVEAAAAADRHVRDFTRMFSIVSDATALEPTDSYLADLAKKGN